jgi:Raf kinase inhibitor-like YbhB/YbcL family protein
MEITSSAFKEGDSIPAKYTCDSLDISPPLKWSKEPEETKTFALICDDPDAPGGTWVHWVIYNIPGTIHEFEEDIAKNGPVQKNAVHGKNDFGNTGYGGPCPPGGTHRYYFKIYALDATLGAHPAITKRELLRLMDGHILDQGQLMGRYKRKAF